MMNEAIETKTPNSLEKLYRVVSIFLQVPVLLYFIDQEWQKFASNQEMDAFNVAVIGILGAGTIAAIQHLIPKSKNTFKDVI